MKLSTIDSPWPPCLSEFPIRVVKSFNPNIPLVTLGLIRNLLGPERNIAANETEMNAAVQDMVKHDARHVPIHGWSFKIRDRVPRFNFNAAVWRWFRPISSLPSLMPFGSWRIRADGQIWNERARGGVSENCPSERCWGRNFRLVCTLFQVFAGYQFGFILCRCFVLELIRFISDLFDHKLH